MARPSRRPPVSRVEQARLRADAAAGDTQTRSLAQAAAVADARQTPPRPWVGPAALAAATLTLLTGWYLWGPTGRDRTWWLALLAVAASAALVRVGIRRWADTPQRPRRATAITCAAVTVLFVVGSYSSVVIDGRVQFTASEAAAAARLVDDVRADLEEIASYDRLMRLDTAAARVEIDSYQPAVDRLAELAGHYSTMEVADLPSDRFVPVLRQMATAADFGSRTLAGKRDLTLQHDARLQANVTSWHETYTAAVLTAGPQLADVANVYGVPLVDPEHDPVE